MEAVDRMFQVLVRTLRATQPALLSSPFTVAELHQHIIPYRHFRRELGVETNQQYELTLMQLLAGSRGYMDVDDRLRDELGKELAAVAPEPARVRDFADAHVSINPAALAGVPEPRQSGETLSPGKPAVAAPGAASATPEARRGAHACRYCGGELPRGRVLNFCPHCGQNLQVLNCPACGAEVEAGWRFCVTCGKSVA